MRARRMSRCGATGVAIFFFRAMCPSSASSAIAATVSPTAVRFAQAPRPNRHTAANPTTTRRNVTLFGVHCILTCQARNSIHSGNGNLHARSCSCKEPLFSHLQTACPCSLPPRASQIHHLSRGGSERSEEHTSELQSPDHLVCRLLLEKKKKNRS